MRTTLRDACACGLLAAGVVAMLLFVVLGVRLEIVRWWVHPDWTRPMIFWGYWPEIVGCVGALGIAYAAVWAAARLSD